MPTRKRSLWFGPLHHHHHDQVSHDYFLSNQEPQSNKQCCFCYVYTGWLAITFWHLYQKMFDRNLRIHFSSFERCYFQIEEENLFGKANNNIKTIYAFFLLFPIPPPIRIPRTSFLMLWCTACVAHHGGRASNLNRTKCLILAQIVPAAAPNLLIGSLLLCVYWRGS